MRHIALEGRCFVLAACQFALRSDYPDDYPVAADGPETVLIGGGSVIIDPLGVVLAGPAGAGEAVLVADLDLATIDRAVLDLDVVGHYARPDIFRLDVDTRPKPAVQFSGG
jgi:predicted amidohydrolase